MKKIFHANTNQKKDGIAMLILDKANLGVRKIIQLCILPNLQLGFTSS